MAASAPQTKYVGQGKKKKGKTLMSQRAFQTKPTPADSYTQGN